MINFLNQHVHLVRWSVSLWKLLLLVLLGLVYGEIYGQDARASLEAQRKQLQQEIVQINGMLQKNKNQSDFFFNLYGDKEKISKELDKQSIKSENLKIYHTKSIVSDEKSPITAVKNSKDSSMWHTIN